MRRFKATFAVAALFSVLAGCAASSASPSKLNYQQRSTDTLRYTGRTIVFYDAYHGTQVEYFAADGSAYLWYPGNRRALPGRWKKRSKTGQICFLYRPKTYNPVTRQLGGKWNCTSLYGHRSSAKASCSGDPFNLRSGAIPYSMAKGKSALARVMNGCSGVPAVVSETQRPSLIADESGKIVAACRKANPTRAAGCECLRPYASKMSRNGRAYLLSSLRKGTVVGVRFPRGVDGVRIGLLIDQVKNGGVC